MSTSREGTETMGWKSRLAEANATAREQWVTDKAERRAQYEAQRAQIREKAAGQRAEIRGKDSAAQATRDVRQADSQEPSGDTSDGLMKRLADWSQQETTPRPRRFAGVTANGETISYKRETYPITGVEAEVQTAGEIDRRMSLTRVAGGGILLGPLGAVLGGVAKKKHDSRQAFLLVSGPEFAWAIEVSRDRLARAHKFAAQVTTLGRQAEG